MSTYIGYISQIIGPVVDVCFPTDEKNAAEVLPKIHDALEVTHPDGRTIVIEVQQHIGEDTVRTVAMDNTDGLHVDWKFVKRVCLSQCLSAIKLRDAC